MEIRKLGFFPVLMLGLSFEVLGEQYSHLDDFEFSDLEVAITPTRTKIPIVDSPVSITQLETSKARMLGLYQYEDIFRLVPGFVVAHYQGHSPKVSYHGTHGHLPRRMEALYDGASIYRSGYSRVNWGRLPVDSNDLNLIEVARGPSVADYGSNSFLSAVNLIGVNPSDSNDNELRISSKGSDSNYLFMKTKFEDPGDQTSIFRAFYNRDNGFDIDSLGDAYSDDKVVSSLMFHHERNRGNANTNARVIYSETEYDINISQYDTLTRNNENSERNLFAGLTLENSWTSDNVDNSMEVNLYASNYKLDQTFERCVASLFFLDELSVLDKKEHINFTPDMIPTIQRAFLGILDGELSLENPQLIVELLNELPLPFNPSDLELEDLVDMGSLFLRMANEGPEKLLTPICGVMDQNVNETALKAELLYRYAINNKLFSTSTIGLRFNQIDSQTYLGGDVTSSVLNFSSHARYYLNRYFTLNGGIMFEKPEDEELAVSPRASLTYKPTRNQAIRMGVSSARRSPDIYETSREWTETYRFIDGQTDLDGDTESPVFKTSKTSTDLKPEKIVAYELSYYTALDVLPIEYDIKLFKEELDNLISEPFVYYEFALSNDGKVDLSGYETQIEYDDGKLALGIVYSHLDSQANNQLEETLYVEHTGALYGIYRFSGNYSLGIGYYGNSTLAGEDYDRSDITVIKDMYFQDRTTLSIQANLRYYDSQMAHFEEASPDLIRTKGYDSKVKFLLAFDLSF